MKQRAKILTLSYAHFSNDINGGALPALLPFFVLNYGFSYTETSVIIFSYGIVSSIVQPLFGYLSDRWSARYLIALGVFWTSVGVGLTGFLPWYWAICACAIFSGMGSSLFHPEGARLANTLGVTGHKAITMSIFAIGGNAGFSLGPMAVGLLIPTFGMHSTIAFPVAAAVAALIIMRILGNAKDLVEPAPLPSGEKQDNGKRNDWKAFGILAGVVLSRSALMSGFHSFIALYWMHEFQATASMGAAVLSAYGFMSVLSNLCGGMLSDRAGYVKILRITQGLLLPALLIFAWTDHSWVALLMAMVIAFSLYSSFSPTVILGQTYLASNVGFSAGVTLGLTQTIGSLTLPVMGIIADNYDMHWAFLFLVIFVIIGIVSSMFLKKTEYDH